jgi:UDP-2,4-diacetamido-2,4,6-trideoxy-beta-L-altropyranose hydrolase
MIDVAFRADASPMIGTGHVIRCLALADELKKRGARCRFICRADAPSLADLIEQHGHSVTILPFVGGEPISGSSPHASWLGATFEVDAQQTQVALQIPPDWLIVDHYAIDEGWEKLLRPFCKKLLVIDDLADRSHDCNLLLDQSPLSYAHRYAGLVPQHTTSLLGPRYALLRNEFEVAKRGMSRQFNHAPRLLVMFGGADQRRQTERVVSLLSSANWSGRIDVVAGPLYPDLGALESAARILPNVTLHINSKNVAVLMSQADIAIGASGTSSLERCAMGLPSIAVAQASNQIAIGESLATAGAHLYLGAEEEVSDHAWLNALCGLVAAPELRRQMSEAAYALCDGLGVHRVAGYMMSELITVRPGLAEDRDVLFQWRNDPRIRMVSHDTRELVYTAHVEWFDCILRDAHVDLLVAELDGQRVACVRFDCSQGSALVSIYVDPSRHGQGIGRGALKSALKHLAIKRRDISKVVAEVLQTNIASHALFQACGFEAVESGYYELYLSQP